MNRVKLSSRKMIPHFIGSWQISDESVTNGVKDYFYLHQDRHQKGLVAGGIDLTRKNSTDLSVDPVNEYGETPPQILCYMDALNNCYQDYIEQWPFLGTLGALDIGNFNIQKYDGGGHFQRLHSERTSLGTSHRVLAWMTYLNTLTDEGETSFNHFDLTISPKAGLTLIWPADWTHAHVGHIVKTKKYIITGWFHFPPSATRNDDIS